MFFLPKAEHAGTVPVVLFHVNKWLLILPQGVFRTTTGGREGVTNAEGGDMLQEVMSAQVSKFSSPHTPLHFPVLTLDQARSCPVESC